MRVEVYFDILCPWCYIGKRRLATALAGRGPRACPASRPPAPPGRWRHSSDRIGAGGLKRPLSPPPSQRVEDA
ncbi:DsbA family protein [Streptomyces sp. NPDC056255]|uniref:DsbA family oxidoreductase n=1 Tax=Streptomyces sp. NPDC056255 TaxID=3345764 RepID=UPI0035E1088E